MQGLNVTLQGLNVTLQRLKWDEYGILERKGISRSYSVRREALTGEISKHGMAVATGRLGSVVQPAIVSSR